MSIKKPYLDTVHFYGYTLTYNKKIMPESPDTSQPEPTETTPEDKCRIEAYKNALITACLKDYENLENYMGKIEEFEQSTGMEVKKELREAFIRKIQGEIDEEGLESRSNKSPLATYIKCGKLLVAYPEPYAERIKDIVIKRLERYGARANIEKLDEIGNIINVDLSAEQRKLSWRWV